MRRKRGKKRGKEVSKRVEKRGFKKSPGISRRVTRRKRRKRLAGLKGPQEGTMGGERGSACRYVKLYLMTTSRERNSV